jgi:hypothetical protein
MAGTRGGLGRIAAMVVALVVMLALVLVDAARAGTYKVAQCGWGIGAELDPAVPRTEGDVMHLHPDYCTAPPPGAPAGMAFEAGSAPGGDQAIARARWVAPPGTSFAGARFTWSGKLSSAVRQVAGVDDGVELHALAAAVGTTVPQTVAADIANPEGAFEVRLECFLHGPFGCVRLGRSTMLLSEVTLTVDDPAPPQVKLGGALLAAGWHRGRVVLELDAEDAVGAGVADVEATVDGAPIFTGAETCAVQSIEGEPRATRLRPCPVAASRTFEVDTAALVDGAHTLRGCATDLGGGRGCAADARIDVDNSPPEVDFSAAPEGQVVARVSDRFSGPAAGTISMRRADAETWTDLQTRFGRGGSGMATLTAPLPDLSPGAYFFRAVATDAAGNIGAALFRAAGSAAEVRRQVAVGSRGSGRGPARRGHGRPTHLVAHLARGDEAGRRGRASASSRTTGRRLTVDFGGAVELRGRLTDARGGGLAKRPVAVVARAAAGIGRPPEHRRVVTGQAGRFALRLPPGISRRVTVAFRGGGGFAPARGRPLALRVRAAVSLAAAPHQLHTGESVTLNGRVRPGLARIPARGKIVTIQYFDRASGRWRPALVVRTDPRGRFKVRYRFRYVNDAARIRLRATALPEAGWPYASGSSMPVTVEVDGW